MLVNYVTIGVKIYGIFCASAKCNLSLIQHNSSLAQVLHCPHIMADKQYGPAFAFAYVPHLADGFLLEFGVAYGKNFVHHENFGFQVGGDGEAQAYGHAAGVALDGGVEVAFAAAEVYDFVHLAGDFGAGHAHDGAVHVDVLAAGHFGVEAGADFEEARDAAPRADGARGGCGHAAEELEERAFACAVAADDAYDVALFHLEVDVLQGPHVVAGTFACAVVHFAHFQVGVLAAQDLGLPESIEVVAERACAYQAQAVLLADVLKLDCGGHE